MPFQPALKPRPRFRLLDGMRFLAAVAVVAYHFTAFRHSFWGQAPSAEFQFLSKFTAYGALGVQLFFIISGFVILMSTQGRSVGQFVTSRVARLFPAYWVAVIAATVLSVLVAPGLFKDVTPSMFLANLTMAQQAVGVPHIDGVYWTLWVELLFYVMVCGLISFKATEGKYLAFAFLWPVTASIAQSTDVDLLKAILSPQYAPLFAGGMVLYLIYANGHSLLRWLLVAFNACLAAQQTTETFVLTSMQKNTGVELSGTIGVIAVLAMFAAIAVVTLSPARHWGPAWLSYAGALTYPIYLVHEIWGWWVIHELHDYFGSKWLTLAAAVATSIVLAMIIERWVERPLRPIITKSLNASFSPAQDRHRDSHQPTV